MSQGIKLGCWIDLPSPQIAEIVAGTGFDYGVIDLEHGAIGVETALLMIMALQGSGAAAIVRLPDQSEAWIKRMLDAGANGLIVPKVETAEQAENIVKYARYAPYGQRGEGLPVARAARWGRNAAAYRAGWQDAISLSLQIESKAGFDTADAIAATPGVTELFFGPADYSAFIGVSLDDPAVEQAAIDVAKIAAHHNHGTGTIVLGQGQVPRRAKAGYTAIAVASDIINLVGALDATLADARKDLNLG